MNYEEIARWLLSRDTGASSRSIVENAMGLSNADRCYPVDVYDFGRCYRMLKACPSVKVDVMHRVSPVWARLVTGWVELTRCYEASLKYKDGKPIEDYYGFQPFIRTFIH